MATAFQSRVHGTTFQSARLSGPRAVFGGARLQRLSQSARLRSEEPASTVACHAAAPTVYPGDLLNHTYYPTSADASNVSKRWYIIDAKGQTLGRLATLAANYIRGKHLPTYSPSMDMGAYVVVINAELVEVSGSKASDKIYFANRAQRPGSSKYERFSALQRRLPERIIERAVQGMLPKGRLGNDIKLHLKVFKGPKHDHEAQQPVCITKEISIRPSEGPGKQLLEQMKAKK